MTTGSRRWRTGYMAVLAIVLAAPLAVAAGTSDFALAKAIPADAFMSVHTRGHDGLSFLNKQCERVWAAVERARFDNDVKRFLKDAMGAAAAAEGETDPFESTWQKLTDQFATVNWSTLGEREYAMGMAMGFPTAEFVSLMRPPADRVSKDFEGLAAILKNLAGLAPPGVIALASEGEGEKVVHRLAVEGAPFPIGFTLARRGDTILVGFGTDFVARSLSLLSGEKGECIADSPRFVAAFRDLPPPTDGFIFADVTRLMQQVRTLVDKLFAMGEQYAVGDPEEIQAEMASARRIIAKLIDAVDVCDYCAAVSTTSGMRTTTDGVSVLRDDAKSKLLYPVLFGPPTIDDPLKYVPKSAGGVTATSGVDFAALYQAIVKFVREDVPDGETHLAMWEGMQQSWDLNVENDLLGWIQGNFISFSIPGPTSFSGQESVFMLRVKDEAKARAMLTRLFTTIEPLLAAQNGAVVDADIEGAEGFRTIKHPMIGMMGMKAPTLGVRDGWLLFGTSVEILTKAFDVAAGKAENFSRNERFLKEGVQPGKNVASLSFADQTRLGEELGQALQFVPFVIQMAGAKEIARNPGMQMVLRVIQKMGTIVREINFLQSASSVSTFDGKRFVSRTYNNYREPPTKPAPESGASENGAPDADPARKAAAPGGKP